MFNEKPEIVSFLRSHESWNSGEYSARRPIHHNVTRCARYLVQVINLVWNLLFDPISHWHHKSQQQQVSPYGSTHWGATNIITLTENFTSLLLNYGCIFAPVNSSQRADRSLRRNEDRILALLFPFIDYKIRPWPEGFENLKTLLPLTARVIGQCRWRHLWEFAATRRLYKLELPTMTFWEWLRTELFANLSEKRWIRVFEMIVLFTQLKSIYNHMTRFPYSLKTFQMKFTTWHFHIEVMRLWKEKYQFLFQKTFKYNCAFQ